MSEPFLGQLMLVPYTFAPAGWAFCQGQLMPIRQNPALFSLLGTQFGGDGRSTYALPNLQGNMPIGFGTGPSDVVYTMGEYGGEESVTLLVSELPSHQHQHAGLSGEGTTTNPGGATFSPLGGRGHEKPYYVAPPAVGSSAQMAALEMQTAGEGQPHSNMMPYLVMNYVIALRGIFPSRP